MKAFETLQQRTLFSKSTIILLFFALCLFPIIGWGVEDKSLIIVNDINLNDATPDTTVVDSTLIEFAFGDTVETYSLGVDSIIVLFDNIIDSTASSDSNYIEARVINNDDIIVSLTNNRYTVNQSIFGANLEGFFNKYTNTTEQAAAYAAIGALNPYQLLQSFKPKVLRSPSGASSKFQHPFGSFNDVDIANPKSGLKNGGYGYKIEEIIRYYDKTFNEMNAPSLEDIIDDMSLDKEISSGWIDSKDMADFNSFYAKWLEQPAYNPAGMAVWQEPLYINNFIDLIQQIETNEGYTIDVICTINILSEPAEKMTEMIDYLRSATLNNKYAVNVVGVELGNECYFEFYERSLGFGCYADAGIADPISPFDHYWGYLNGANNYDSYFSIPALSPNDFNLADVLDPTTMLGGDKHDYIGALRTNSAYNNIKIGIPVANPDLEDGAFIISEPGLLEEPAGSADCVAWNTEILERYDDKIDGRYLIDAVIPHLYYDSENAVAANDNTNWGEIPIGNYDYTPPVGDPIHYDYCLDNNTANTTYDNFTTSYTFDDYDERLACAFDGILDYSITGSFRKFIRLRQKQAMLALATELQLDGTGEHFKECWITEWNIKNGADPGEEGSELDAMFQRKEVFSNSFVHAYITQEEFLNNIKFNYTNGFESQFLTITSINNFLGGSSTNLVKNSTTQDLIALYLQATCADGFKPYLARTIYHSFSLVNQIHLQNLKYLKTNQTLYHTNINHPPTVFIEQAHGTATERDIYFYFTNIKKYAQTYIIRPGTLTDGSFEGLLAQVYCIDAKKPYSRSGHGGLFDINNFYAGCNAAGYADWYEINSSIAFTYVGECPTDMPAGATCVTVPAYSSGYFKLTYNPSLRIGEQINRFQIFPNPASTSFTIQSITSEDKVAPIEVAIFNLYGNLIATQTITDGSRVDITQLPVGMYGIVIKAGNNTLETEQLIKMK